MSKPTRINGMAAKKARRALAKRFTSDGLPVDAKEWTEEDWRDLHEAMEVVKRKVGKRHKPLPCPEES